MSQNKGFNRAAVCLLLFAPSEHLAVIYFILLFGFQMDT